MHDLESGCAASRDEEAKRVRADIDDPYAHGRHFGLGVGRTDLSRNGSRGGGGTYATVNVQDSCNNLCDTAPDSEEYATRNAADIAWLEQTFDEAQAKHSAAVMIIGQADPGFDATDATR